MGPSRQGRASLERGRKPAQQPNRLWRLAAALLLEKKHESAVALESPTEFRRDRAHRPITQRKGMGETKTPIPAKSMFSHRTFLVRQSN